MTASDGIAWIDGTYVPIAEARIPILDWGFLRSDATYDVVHVWRGRFFRLDDHLDRFANGMARLHYSLPFRRERIAEICHECVRRSELREAYVEMVCTRGLASAGSRDPRRCTNRFYAFAVPFIWIANEEQRARGLRLTVSKFCRIPASSVDATVKNYHWLDFTAGLLDAYERGGETCVLVDAAGNLTEGPGFNLFVFDGHRLRTPAVGVLEGVTRRSVIELAREVGVEVRQEAVSASALDRAQEVFATSTAGGIVPVTSVDGRPVGDGAVGELTKRLRARYWELHDDSRYSTPVEYGTPPAA